MAGGAAMNDDADDSKDRGSAPDKREMRRRLWISLGALLIGFAGAEVYARLAYGELNPKQFYKPGIYQADEDLVWTLRPGYKGAFYAYTDRRPLSLNARGYRGPEETEARRSAELRVVVIGDSQGFGKGIADGLAFPEQLEKTLRAEGRSAAVFNLCVPGYDTYRERIVLERSIERLRPQVVMLSWYRNDAVANVPLPPEANPQVIDGYLIEDQEAYLDYKDRIEHRAWRRLALLRLVSMKWKLYKKARKFTRRVDEVDAFTAEQLAPSIREINKIQELCKARGARFILLVHPNREALFQPELNRPMVKILEDGVLRAPFKEMSALLSIAEAWAGIKDQELYLPGDRSHPNPDGHRRIAELLAGLPMLQGQ